MFPGPVKTTGALILEYYFPGACVHEMYGEIRQMAPMGKKYMIAL